MIPARTGATTSSSWPMHLLLAVGLWLALSLAIGALGVATSATLVLVAVILAPVAYIIVRYPVAGGALLLFVLYTRISDVGIDQHGLPSIAQPFVFVLAALIFIRRTRQGGALSIMPHMGLWGAAAIYGAVLYASSIWAVVPAASIKAGTELFKNLLIVYIIVETFDTPKRLRVAAWALIAAGASVSALSVFQAVTHTYSNTYWGLAQAPIREITIRSNDHRASGPVGDPVFYALILSVIVPLALMRLRDERNGLLRLAALGSIVLLLCALVLTFSRGGLVTLAVVLLSFVVMTRVRLSQILITLVIAAPLAMAFVPASYWQRAGYITGAVTGAQTGSQTDASLTKRVSAGETALAMFAAHPLTGVGAENYSFTYFPYALALNEPSAAPYSHDVYLQVASETGLMGLVPYLLILWLALRTAWRARRAARRARDHLAESLATGHMLALVAYLFGVAFLPAAYPRYLWLLVGLVMASALAHRYRATPDGTAAVPAATTAPPWRSGTAVPGLSGARAIQPGAGESRRRTSFAAQILRGGVLSYGSFLASKALVWGSTVVLARLLAPKDFGLVGIALLIMSFLDVLKNLGVTSALIYRQDIRDEDAGETFVLNVITGLCFFGVAWLIAPLAAGFFHDPRVTLLLRVLGCSFVLSGISGVHLTLLQRKMSFGRRLVPDLLQSIIRGAVSIGLAIHGVGYWSLVWGQLAGAVAAAVASLALWPWIPRLTLRWASARKLLGYGLHITFVDLLGNVTANTDYLIIGRTLGQTPLGLYSIAYAIPQMLTMSLSVSLSRVLFPAYALIQNDHEKLRQGYLLVLRYSALILVPVGLGLCAVAPAFFHTIYTSRYWPAMPALQALSIYATIYAIGWNAGDVWKATGRPDIIWKLSIAQAIVLVPALLLGARLDGFVGVAIMQIVVIVPYSMTRFWLTHRAIGLPLRSIARALSTPIAAGLVMVATCIVVDRLASVWMAPVAILGLQVLTGGVVYVAVALAIDPELRTRTRDLLIRRAAVDIRVA